MTFSTGLCLYFSVPHQEAPPLSTLFVEDVVLHVNYSGGGWLGRVLAELLKIPFDRSSGRSKCVPSAREWHVDSGKPCEEGCLQDVVHPTTHVEALSPG
jgi:hypothetical protein